MVVSMAVEEGRGGAYLEDPSEPTAGEQTVDEAVGRAHFAALGVRPALLLEVRQARLYLRVDHARAEPCQTA